MGGEASGTLSLGRDPDRLPSMSSAILHQMRTERNRWALASQGLPLKVDTQVQGQKVLTNKAVCLLPSEDFPQSSHTDV